MRDEFTLITIDRRYRHQRLWCWRKSWSTCKLMNIFVCGLWCVKQVGKSSRLSGFTWVTWRIHWQPLSGKICCLWTALMRWSTTPRCLGCSKGRYWRIQGWKKLYKRTRCLIILQRGALGRTIAMCVSTNCWSRTGVFCRCWKENSAKTLGKKRLEIRYLKFTVFCVPEEAVAFFC